MHGPGGSDPARAIRPRRSDHLGAQVPGQLDHQHPGDTARAMDQHSGTGPGAERAAKNLVGGQGGNGQRPGNLGRHRIRDRRHIAGRSHEPLRPRALGTQRQRVGHHPLPGHDPAHRAADPDGNAGGFHAKRHRRPPAEVPAARPGDIVPVPHARAAHLHQHLIGLQLVRSAQLEELNRSGIPTYPRYSHSTLRAWAVTTIVLLKRGGAILTLWLTTLHGIGPSTTR